jgi:protein SCO1/2
MLGDGSYTMDHSGNIALINAKGHYIGFFKGPQDLARLKATYRAIRAQAD